MLDPNYLQEIAESAAKIYDGINDWAVKDIIQRLIKSDFQVSGTVEWRMKVMLESGKHYEEIIKEIALITKKAEKEVKEVFEEAGIKAIEYDDAIYRKAGLNPPSLLQSPRLLELMQTAYEGTLGELSNFTRTLAESSQKQLIQTLDNTYFKVNSGMVGYNQAIKEAVAEISKSGIYIDYPSGHRDTIETAVTRAIRTGVSQATARMQLARMEEMGIDTVLVSAHMGARVGEGINNHFEWQGKIYSLSGKSDKYPSFYEHTGYGKILGLCGINCRHHFSPYIEGVSHNPYSEFDNEKNEEMYKLTQKQRRLERNIRATKRNLQGLDSAKESTGDEVTKFELQMEYDKMALKLRKQNQAYKDFCKDNDLRTVNERLQIANWNRSQAMKAVQGAKRAE